MPRKQRFKPSRKPKPNPQNEDAMMGRPVSNVPLRDDSAARETPQVPEDRAPVEAKADLLSG